MHQKKSVSPKGNQIGGEGGSGVSSDFNLDPGFFGPQPHLIRTQNQFRSDYHPQAHAHLTIQIPQAHRDSFSPETRQTLVSTPHKRPIVVHPQHDSRPPEGYRHTQDYGNPTSLDLDSSPFRCPPHLLTVLSSIRFSVPFASNQSARKLCRYILRARLICFHLRFLLVLSLPLLYLVFLIINLHLLLFVVVSVLAFSIVLIVSINPGLAHLPSIRLFIARSLPLKLNSVASSSRPQTKKVVWSIGPKPKSEKKVNSGSWVKTYRGGDVYEGEFHKGKCSGSGVYYYSMKGKYEGDWVDGKYDGYGVETWAKGSRYRGQYRRGMRNGIGVYRFYTGDVYAGEWSNGQCHGYGVYTSEDGSKYVGEFKWGVKHGLGHYHFRNGDTYAGEYFADKMHGFGLYQFGNGHRYEGAWHEGRRQGLGMYTFRNGETQAGHWENGVLNIPSTPSTHPGSHHSVSHARVLDAVQKARLAAERANDITKVDDRVNRAIMAANRAANAARVAAVKAVQKQVHHSADCKAVCAL